MKLITLSVLLRNRVGKQVNAIVCIRKGLAMFVSQDKNLAKQLYEKDKADGLDVAYNEKHNAYIQKFDGQTPQQILKKIRAELEAAGGKIVETDKK